MLNWSIEQKVFQLKYNWKLSRNEATFKTNFFVKVSDGLNEGIGEIAPNIRYNETPQSVLKEFEIFRSKHINFPEDALQVSSVINEIPAGNAVKFGLESALLHFLCRKKRMTLEQLLQINPSPSSIPTCYTIPIMEPGEIKAFIKHNSLDRFPILKVKVEKDSALDCIREVLLSGKHRLIIDANESWTDPDNFLQFVSGIKDLDILFIEQPFPARCTDEYIFSKKQIPFKLFADESVQNSIDYDFISQQFDGINVKLMKAGGYINALNMIRSARSLGLMTMIGCMVESTLGISSAFHLASLTDYADLDGYFIIANEPFQLVSEKNGKLFLNN